jgi:hypothetical protein
MLVRCGGPRGAARCCRARAAPRGSGRGGATPPPAPRPRLASGGRPPRPCPGPALAAAQPCQLPHTQRCAPALPARPPARSVDFKSSKKKKDKKKKGEEARLDYYALLGLQHERWMANENQIKLAYRKTCLEHHPDKKCQGARRRRGGPCRRAWRRWRRAGGRAPGWAPSPGACGPGRARAAVPGRAGAGC